MKFRNCRRQNVGIQIWVFPTRISRPDYRWTKKKLLETVENTHVILKKIEQFPQKKNFFSNFDYDQKIVADTSRFWIKAQELINVDKKLRFAGFKSTKKIS